MNKRITKLYNVAVVIKDGDLNSQKVAVVPFTSAVQQPGTDKRNEDARDE